MKFMLCCVHMLNVNDCFREKRIAEMKAMQLKAKYGEVKEISAVDYINEVNKAGDDVWVVLHLYQQGYPFQLISTIVFYP